MNSGQEVELKLEIEAEAAFMLRGHPLLKGQPSRSTNQVSTYFDTPDGALREAGYSLRIRQSGDRFIQTVKEQGNGAAGLFDRPEWEREVGGAEPDNGAIDDTPVGGLLGSKARKKLAPVVRAEVRRTIWDLPSEDGEIELILDEGTISGGKRSESLAEVELELKNGDAGKLMKVARELARDVPLRLGVLSKAERGFALANGNAGKVAKAEPIALRRDMTVAEGFAAIASACLRHFRLNEPLVTAQRDPGALHQARVAMRRLRSAFTLFKPAIADAEWERLRGEVKWFTDQLGDARNFDVLLKRLEKAPRKVRESVAPELQGARERAYDQVRDALASARLRSLIFELLAWIETGEWRQRKRAQRPLRAFASEQLDRRWRRVRQQGYNIAGLEPEPRHQLRIEIKKMRYATEFLSSLQTEPKILARQKEFLGALEEMQEQLGELNDAETARHLLAPLLGSRLDKTIESLFPTGASEASRIRAAQNAHKRLLETASFWN